MSVTNQQVVTLLENVLFETATQAAVNAGAWINNAAAGSVQSLAAAMASSGEEKIAATVVGFYLSALGRAPSAAEIHYYAGIAEQGLTQAQIAAGQVASTTWDTIGSYFAHSPEFASRGNLDFSLGNTGAYLEAVPWLYESVLGRTPSNAEIAYYDAQVVNGADLGVLFREFTASPEFHTDTDAQIAAALVTYGTTAASGQQTPPAVGSTVTLGAPPPPAPTPTQTPTPTPTFGTLTVRTDHIDNSAMAGVHTYQAILGTGATLNTNDYLNGNGSAILDIQDNGTGGFVLLPVGPLTLSGIATVILTTGEDVGTTGGNPFDLSGVTGLTTFNLTATGTGMDFIKVGAGVAVTASADSSLFNLTATGTGNTLALTDASLSTLGVTGGFTGNIGTVSLTSTGGPTSLTLDLLGIASLHFTDSNHLTSIAIEALSGTNSISAISDTALTDLSVGANSQVDFGSASAYVALSSSVTTLDTSGDYFGNAYFDVGSATVAATFGAETSFITGSIGGAITLDGNAHSTGDVTVNGFDALTIAAHSYSSVTLTGAGASVDITDTSMTNIDIDGLTLSGTLTAGSAGLIITGTSTASSIGAITDSNLTTLTVTGNVQLGSNASTGLSLPSNLTSLDLSADTANNFVQVNNTGMTIKVGTDALYNSATPAPNLVLDVTGPLTIILNGQSSVSGPLGITPSGTPLTEAAFLSVMLDAANAGGNPGVVYGATFNGNSYIVEDSGSSPGANSTTIIELIGTSHGLSVTSNHIVLS